MTDCSRWHAEFAGKNACIILSNNTIFLENENCIRHVILIGIAEFTASTSIKAIYSRSMTRWLLDESIKMSAQNKPEWRRANRSRFSRKKNCQHDCCCCVRPISYIESYIFVNPLSRFTHYVTRYRYRYTAHSHDAAQISFFIVRFASFLISLHLSSTDWNAKVANRTTTQSVQKTSVEKKNWTSTIENECEIIFSYAINVYFLLCTFMSVKQHTHTLARRAPTADSKTRKREL